MHSVCIPVGRKTVIVEFIRLPIDPDDNFRGLGHETIFIHVNDFLEKQKFDLNFRFLRFDNRTTNRLVRLVRVEYCEFRFGYGSKTSSSSALKNDND